MKVIIAHLRALTEKYGFGVCQYLGDRMGIASGTIRKYFIYTSFITIGSPLIVYLFAAFWLDLKRHLRRGRDLLRG